MRYGTMKMSRSAWIAIMGLALVAMSTRVVADKVAADPGNHEDLLALELAAYVIPDTSGIRMIRIEAGTFMMGSPEDEAGRSPDETQRQVTISRPFYMAETPVTQEQYIPVNIPDYKPLFIFAAAGGKSLPEIHSEGPFHTADRTISDSSRQPMEGVTWEKAMEFCARITARERDEGRLPEGYVYRLPTEAEWEYACRAGTTGPFNVSGAINEFAVGPGLDRPRPVKEERTPNAWGLYDMHGNVYEWCLDDYAPYGDGPATDPVGSSGDGRKVARGGCYLSGTLEGRDPDPVRQQRRLRSAARGRFQPDFPLPIVGLRIVLAPEM